METVHRSAFLAGDWVVEPELNALRKDHVEHHIEPKVMRVLLTLASRQNHVFSKEELISAVWPDTFVSDDVLTRCISILRRVTEDNPQAPRFIQTVPKVGYRLVAIVEDLPATTLARSVIETLDAVPGQFVDPLRTMAHEAQVQPPVTTASRPVTDGVPAHGASVAISSKRWISLWGWWIVLTAALLMVFGALLWRSLGHFAAPELTFRTIPFTSYAGEQTEPAFSPNGQVIAFVRTFENGPARRICLKSIGTESVAELTQDKDEQFSPAWSPDGKEIAYLTRSPTGLGLNLVSSTPGSAPHRVFIPQEPSHWEQGALSWSPDGRSLIFPDHTGSSPNSSIYRLDLASLRAESITSPPPGWEGDLNPAFSPDGTRIAFTRASETAVRDIYWLDLRSNSLHQLTHDRMNLDGLAWSRDGRSILFSSNRGGKYSLWAMALTGAEPERLPFGTEDSFQPSVGPLPGQLAYTQGSAIWSIDLVHAGSMPATTAVSSTQQDSAPSLSPDGRFFAFQSRQSGNQEVWIAALDGNNVRQLTAAAGPVTGSPSWSHHDNTILFDSRPDGHSHIFAMPAAGGQATQLTFGNNNDIVPRWSRDDNTVYFRSNRGGRWQLWKVSRHGGEPQPLTTGDGIAPQESLDGRWLYYTRGDDAGLWRVPVGGGAEVSLLPQPAAGYWGYFQVTQAGILYLDQTETPGAIRLFVPEKSTSTTVTKLLQAPPVYQGLSATEDGQVLLLTGERDAGRHITLVEESR